MTDNLIFKASNISVAYDRKLVVEDLSIEIPEGTLVAIVGPNGAGKSTFIKAVLGLVPRITGYVEAFGKRVARSDPRIGYVPQRESVDWDFPVSVLDVALMGTYSRVGWFLRPGKKEVADAEEALDRVGMLAFKDRQISQLSGGQQQRTFLARALAQHADLYFMDEPFAGVDAATEAAIIEVLRKLRDEKKTVIAVHHDLDTVPNYFDHVVLINKRLVASGEVINTFNAKNLTQTYGGKLHTMPIFAAAEG